MGVYQGYRLKINGNIIPNTMMSRGSWNAKASERLIASWYDATGTLHESYYPIRKATIQFAVRPHNLAEHSLFSAYFLNKKNVQVVYWDDDICDYRNCVCKIEEIDWSHSNALDNGIQYDSASVSIMEY